MLPAHTDERFVALDSLRGLAALTVVVWHVALLLLEVPATSPYYPGAKLLRLWQISPLYPLMAGREAVIIFFVLSGFVLSLPWVKGRNPPYGSFLIKRVCWIYVPYLAAILLAFLGYAALGGQTVLGLSGFSAATWSHDPSLQEIIQHLTLISSFDNEQYALVLWSLVHEMRVSIIFPFLMIPIMRLHWSINLAWSLCVSLIGTFLTAATDGATDYPATLHYLVFFVVGALMAKERVRIVYAVQHLSKLSAVATFFAGFMLYSYSRVLSNLLGKGYWSGDLEELFVGVGAGLLIAWLLASVSAQRVMKWRPLIFLGYISYSLYLLHPLVILSLIHAFAGTASVYTLLALALPLSIFVSWLSYLWVERPSIRLGRWLSAREQRKNAVIAELP